MRHTLTLYVNFKLDPSKVIHSFSPRCIPGAIVMRVELELRLM